MSFETMIQAVYKISPAKIYKIFIIKNARWWVDICHDLLSVRGI